MEQTISRSKDGPVHTSAMSYWQCVMWRHISPQMVIDYDGVNNKNKTKRNTPQMHYFDNFGSWMTPILYNILYRYAKYDRNQCLNTIKIKQLIHTSHHTYSVVYLFMVRISGIWIRVVIDGPRFVSMRNMYAAMYISLPLYIHIK